MTDELSTLLKELESDDFEVRKSTMERLGNLGTNKAVRALIHVAGGGPRITGPRITYPFRTFREIWVGIKSFFTFDFPSEYTLEDQLSAIQSLAETAHPTAYRYLMHLTDYKVVDSWDNANYGGGSLAPSVWDGSYDYPRISGALRERLCFVPRNAYSDDIMVRLPYAPERERGTRGNSPDKFPKRPEMDVIINAQNRIKETASQYQR